ncbi:uncharacterized protein LOC112347917 isoform X2 [Selaginella moellendorffii]|uniref:uncharacterized protein LOC112347917 isoform X2 n=1 Tax=Selaginella moellendorffii TaxID=88036 RepID=UPI000D1C8C2A|nr:uncharacterized protein LOC112347917 isoform X2 [Selaginella moellendorffii]|eukprot:XP_024535402.1 uncharacterized protein LOC112347917 isoform X2 [Selaginella moellendorffii]
MAQEDSCCVICDAAKCDVYFSPCSHRACKDCVQRIRIANVYKADKGVKCPFCRQTIEGYLDAPPTKNETVNFPTKVECRPLPEENIFGRRGNMSIGRGNDYIPCRAATGGLKMVFKVAEVPPGYVIPPLRPDADIHAMAFDKRAINLVFMLREDYSKRHKVAKTCRDVLTPFALRLALHGSANYVLQGMLDYAAAFRDDATNGESFFTALVRSLCRKNGFVKAAHDPRGTFSVQKMLSLVQGSEELRLVMKGITGSVAAMSLHQSGAYVIQWLAERLISSLRCPGPQPRFPEDEAVKSLAHLAIEMTTNADILNIGVHPVTGPLLVEIIRWSLPDDRSMKAAVIVARHAKKLTGLENGHRILQGILSVEVKEVAEELIKNLEGKYPDMLMDSISWKLVQACLATRCVDESSRLLIIDELLDSLDSASEITDTHHGCKVLVFGLATLTQSSLEDRLQVLKSRVYSRKFESLYDGVEGMRWSLFESEATDDETSPRISQGLSEDSVCAVSMDVDGDYEEQEQAESVTSDSSSPSPCQGVAVQPRVPSPSMKTYQAENFSHRTDEPLLPLPSLPTVKPGTYAPPHVRQALALANTSCRVASAIDQPVSRTGTPPTGGSSLGAIGSQRENSLARSSCVVCSSRNASTVFLDCSHMCCCLSCAYSRSSCPVCAMPIRQVIKVESSTAATTSSSQVSSSCKSPTVYPSASDLLPSDLFQTISLSCDSPPVSSQHFLTASSQQQFSPVISSSQQQSCSIISSSQQQCVPVISSSQQQQFSPAISNQQVSCATSGLERFGISRSLPSTSYPGTGYYAATPRPAPVNTTTISTTTRAVAGPRPYRPPDVFNNGRFG